MSFKQNRQEDITLCHSNKIDKRISRFVIQTKSTRGYHALSFKQNRQEDITLCHSNKIDKRISRFVIQTKSTRGYHALSFKQNRREDKRISRFVIPFEATSINIDSAALYEAVIYTYKIKMFVCLCV